VFGASVFCLLFAWQWFGLGSRSSNALLGGIVGNGAGAIAVTAIGVWESKKRKTAAINIDGDLIVSRINGSFRKLHRDQIKTVVESNESLFREGGMLLSKHGWLGTRYLGGIWIPRELPGYETVKRFVEERSLAC
jgi:hypothetical protein